MPTMVIFKGERSLDELTSRLFKAGGEPQARKQATDALLKANPQLTDLTRVPVGSVIVVPDTAIGANAGETVRPVDRSVADTIRSARDQITAITAALPTASASATDRINTVLKLVKDKAVTAAAKDQDLAQRLTKITETQNSALKDIQANQKLVQGGLAQMQADLAKLLPPATMPTTSPASPPTPQPQVPNEPPTPATSRSTSSRAKPNKKSSKPRKSRR
jgi:phage tail protein X